MRHSAQLLPRNATRAHSCLKNGHVSSWPSSPHSEAVRETCIILGQCSTCCCWRCSGYRRRPDARMRPPSRTNKRVNRCPSELNHTERRLLVATPCAIASAQCHKGPFLLEKRTRLFLALLAAFGGRPGDVYHSGTMLHLLLLVRLRV